MGFSIFSRLIDEDNNNVETLDGLILIDWNNFCMKLAELSLQGHISAKLNDVRDICDAIVNCGLQIIVIADGKSNAARCAIKLSRYAKVEVEIESTESTFAYDIAYDVAKKVFKACPEERYTYQRVDGEADPIIRRIARENLLNERNVYIFSGDASLIVGVAQSIRSSRLLKLVNLESLSTGEGSSLSACVFSVDSFLQRLNELCNINSGLLYLPNIAPMDLPIIAAFWDDERRIQDETPIILKFIAYFLWSHDDLKSKGFQTMFLLSAGLLVKAARHRELFFVGTNDLDPNLFFRNVVEDCLGAAQLFVNDREQPRERIRICSYFLRGRNRCNARNCANGEHLTREQIDVITEIVLCIPVVLCHARCGECKLCRYGGCQYGVNCFKSHNLARRTYYNTNTRILEVLIRTNTENFHNVCQTLIEEIGLTIVKKDTFINELIRRYQFALDEVVPADDIRFKSYYPDDIGISMELRSLLTSLYYQLDYIDDASFENYLEVPDDHIEFGDSNSFNTWFINCFKVQNENENVPNDYVTLFTEYVDMATVQDSHTPASLFQLIDEGNQLPLNGVLVCNPPPTGTTGLRWFTVAPTELMPRETCHPTHSYQLHSISALSNLRKRAELFKSIALAKRRQGDEDSILTPNLVKEVFGFNSSHYNTNHYSTNHYDVIADRVVSFWNELTGNHETITSPNSVLVMLSTLYSFSTMAHPTYCMELFGAPLYKVLPRVVEAFLLSPLFALAAAAATNHNEGLIWVNKSQDFDEQVSSMMEEFQLVSDLQHYNLIDWIDDITESIFYLIGGDNWDDLSWYDLLGISTSLLLLKRQHPLHVPELRAILHLADDANFDGQLQSTTEAITSLLYTILFSAATL